MVSPLDFCIDFIVVRDTQKLCCCLVAKSCLTLGTPQTVVTHQAPLSMGFSRQEYWSGLQFLSPGDLPDPGIKPESAALQVDSLPLNHWGSPGQMVQFSSVAQSCLILHNPMDHNMPGLPVHHQLPESSQTHLH